MSTAVSENCNYKERGFSQVLARQKLCKVPSVNSTSQIKPRSVIIRSRIPLACSPLEGRLELLHIT